MALAQKHDQMPLDLGCKLPLKVGRLKVEESVIFSPSPGLYEKESIQ